MTSDPGEKYAVFEQGKLKGYTEVVMIDGKKVAKDIAVKVLRLKEAALKDGLKLMVNSGFRTQAEQLALRKQNSIDRAKAGDVDFLMQQPSYKFNPATALPGWSNHQNGIAVDYEVSLPAVYAWMATHAHLYGWVRTVPSERWHWEYRPGTDRFAFVPSAHETWNGLV